MISITTIFTNICIHSLPLAIISFSKYSYAKSPSIRRRTRIMIIAVPILLLVITLPFLSRDNIVSNIVFWIIFSFLWMLYVLFINKRSVVNIARHLYREGEYKTNIGKHTIEIRSEYIVENTDYSELKTKWSAVNKIEVEFII